jgi:glycosyltransferase involved in cell wall biosynthesis
LPPARSGVADYAARLNRELRREFEILASESASAAELRAFDAALYHLGNNRLHAGAYQPALAHPGIVVLHDAVLHHFYLGHLPREQYVEEFVYNEGEWFRGRAAEYWRSSAAAESDERYFRYPMLRRVVERSRAAIVHNPRARRMVEQAAGLRAPGLRIFEIPHFVEPPRVPDAARRAAIRRKYGVPEEPVVIACLGYLRPSKRVVSLLDAIRSLDVPYALLLAGEFTSADYENSILRRAAGIPLVRVPHLPEEEWFELASIADICVNLRYPSAGETSGIVMRMMAMGKPVVVTHGEEVASLPAHAVVRVDHGEAEVEMLAEFLRALSRDVDLCESIGAAAREHVLAHHSINRVAKQYADAIRTVAGAA